MFAYFIYSLLRLAGKMTCQNSCYHIFGENVGDHQTSMPVILDDDKVRVCDNDVLTFVLGG